MTSVTDQREAQRNRLLRRADWRFLLPDACPRKSMSFATGALGQAVAEVSQATVPARLDPVADCDLVVAENPDRATLRAAQAALRPGGSLYAEWRSPLAGGEPGIRDRLVAAGFRDVQCYWAWPQPDRQAAAFWLPLGSSTALRFFQSSLAISTSPWGRALYDMRWLLWSTAKNARLLFPISAVARKPLDVTLPRALVTSVAPPSNPREGSSSSVFRPSSCDVRRTQRHPWEGNRSSILDGIKRDWVHWGLDAPPQRLAWFLLMGGYRSVNKIVGLVFADAESTPRLAVKMPRVPDSIPALEKEALTLRAIHDVRPGGVPGVPRTLAYQHYGGVPTLVETALTGAPVWAILRPDNYRQIALQATDWLLNLIYRGPAQPRAEWWERLAEPALNDFERNFGSIVDANQLHETRCALSRLGDLPMVVEQRDFSPWNVLIAGDGELIVLDWESAELQGLPVLDLIYFLTYLAFLLEGVPILGGVKLPQARKAYQASMTPHTFTGRVLDECMTRYAQAAGLAPASLSPLRLLAWLIHSRSDYRRFTADQGGKPDADTLRRSRFVSLWEEELRCCR